MKPQKCQNCCANEFIELDDAYVCAYCNSRYSKEPARVTAEPPVKVVTEIRYVEVPAPAPTGRKKNKWIALVLCFYLGMFGGHKFYEGQVGKGVLYLLTFGLLGLGWLADIFILLFKPNPYYVD